MKLYSQKLQELEKEEEEREKNGFYKLDIKEEDDATKEIHRLAELIREKSKINSINRELDKNTNTVVAPRNTPKRGYERSVSRMRKEFSELGVDMSDVRGTHFTRTRSNSRGPPLKKMRMQSTERERSRSRPPTRDMSGVRDVQVCILCMVFTEPFTSCSMMVWWVCLYGAVILIFNSLS